MQPQLGVQATSTGLPCGWWATLPCAAFFPGAHSSSPTKGKTTEKARLGDSLQDIWLVSLKAIKVTEKKGGEKERLSDCHRAERTGEACQPRAMWCPGRRLEYKDQSLVNRYKAMSASLTKIPWWYEMPNNGGNCLRDRVELPVVPVQPFCKSINTPKQKDLL